MSDEVRNKSEEEKVLAFIEKEESAVNAEFLRLQTARNVWIPIRIKVPSQDDIVIKAKPQKRRALVEFQKRMGDVDGRLLNARPDELIDPPLTLEQQDKLEDISLDLIEQATQLPKDRFKKEVDDVRVMNALVEGIFLISSQSAEQMENLKKFRARQ